MKVAVINYGMGNLSSVRRALEDVDVQVIVANRPSCLYEVNRIVLPGVGSFHEGMKHLTQGGWIEALHDVVTLQGKPLLGICLGMQMLADTGSEGGFSNGLGLIPGTVRRLDELGCGYQLRIPHVGWNEVHYQTQDVLFESIPNKSDFYFVHSYAFVPLNDSHLVATVPYGLKIPAVVRNKHIFGCQFHPEKSSKAGRQLLRNFIDYEHVEG